MSIFGNNAQPHYYAVSSLKLAGSLFVCAFTTISAFLQLVFFILQGIIDWLNQFIMIRIILFPFTYWIRYKYVESTNYINTY